MIEERIITFLTSSLSVPVYGEVPEGGSGDFVVIEKTGSSRENRVDSATIAAQSYSDSLANAAALNEVVKEAMLSMVWEADISAVRLNSDYNYTDTSTKRYRYQAVFVVTYY